MFRFPACYTSYSVYHMHECPDLRELPVHVALLRGDCPGLRLQLYYMDYASRQEDEPVGDALGRGYHLEGASPEAGDRQPELALKVGLQDRAGCSWSTEDDGRGWVTCAHTTSLGERPLPTSVTSELQN